MTFWIGEDRRDCPPKAVVHLDTCPHCKPRQQRERDDRAVRWHGPYQSREEALGACEGLPGLGDWSLDKCACDVLHPNDYWSREREQNGHKNGKGPSWRLYVALCELASSFLDYATGLEFLEEDSAGAGRTRSGNEAPAGQTRLNWASTCFYYSLVHMGRSLVFVPFGDFPTGHDKLPSCFRGGRQSQALGETNWLNAFARRLEPCLWIEGSKISAKDLKDRWRGPLAWDETERCAQWLGTVLDRGRQLRNENNYEGLLIVNEYRHVWITKVFGQLAEYMRNAADKGLTHAARAFTAYLQADTREPWDHRPAAKLGYTRKFIQQSVQWPVREWYGGRIGRHIDSLLVPFAQLTLHEDATAWDTISADVDFELFSGKRALMKKFQDGVESLRTLNDSNAQ